MRTANSEQAQQQSEQHGRSRASRNDVKLDEDTDTWYEGEEEAPTRCSGTGTRCAIVASV
jgi:hypothetical protein